MKFMKPLSSKGFGHVELVLAIVIVAIVSFVGIRVMTASHAATVAYLTQSGCSIRGRTWVGGTGNPCGSTCLAGAGTLVVAPVYNYCSGAETAAKSISQATCASYGRVWLLDGCARRADQKTTAKAVQCANTTYTYTVESPYDKCVAPAVATAPKPPTPSPSPTPTPVTTSPPPVATTPPTTHTNTAVAAGRECTVRGRVTSGTTCTTSCASGAGSLVTSGTYAYCSSAVSKFSESYCTTTLGRYWVTDGCARRADQRQTANAPQCANTAYTYYISAYDICYKANTTVSAPPPPTITTVVVTTSGSLTACKADNHNDPSVRCVLGKTSSTTTSTPKPPVVTCATAGQTVSISGGTECKLTHAVTCNKGYDKKSFYSGSTFITECVKHVNPVASTTCSLVGWFCPPAPVTYSRN